MRNSATHLCNNKSTCLFLVLLHARTVPENFSRLTQPNVDCYGYLTCSKDSYGNLAPKTGPGKVVTIIYALIGEMKTKMAPLYKDQNG
ncbi:hypothetical protein OUZ56_005837 [Daphnia magna]|uniref:Uncharacterized protein n=1 Tax=Daphnia magna TaxID=35525 RepID=A0ABQ9YTW5_9CRUS|nr:hypothetical protein OUZ56_005837 [Daphnia magna]